MKYIKSFLIVALYFFVNFILFKSVAYLFYNTSFYNISSFKSVIDNNPHIPYITWFGLGIIILALIIKPIKKKSLSEYCNFSAVGKEYWWTLIYIGIGGFIFNTAFINISFIDKNYPQFDAFLKFNYENSFVVFGILSAVIIGPIYEEILFRGLMYNELRESMPLPVAALIQSVLYGVLFFDIPLGAFCFVAALLYSFVYYYMKSLWSIIIIQVVQTFGVLVSRRMGIENVISNIGDKYIIPAFILSIAIIVHGCYCIWRKSNSEQISSSAVRAF